MAQYKTDSMVYLIGLEAAWAIDHRSMPFPSVATEDEIAEFLTKTQRNECKNMQNRSFDGCYLRFEEYVKEKTFVYILRPKPKFRKVYKKISLLRTLKWFELIIKQLLNSAFLRCQELCRSRRMLSTPA